MNRRNLWKIWDLQTGDEEAVNKAMFQHPLLGMNEQGKFVTYRKLQRFVPCACL